VPLYLARIQGYNAEQIGGVLIWLGLPQLVIIPLMPKLMRMVDSRRLVAFGFALFIAGSLMAANLSDDFSGPQFIASSLTRAVAQALMMTPLSAIAIAGIEHEQAGSPSPNTSRRCWLRSSRSPTVCTAWPMRRMGSAPSRRRSTQRIQRCPGRAKLGFAVE
jgi:MFS family permease